MVVVNSLELSVVVQICTEDNETWDALDSFLHIPILDGILNPNVCHNLRLAQFLIKKTWLDLFLGLFIQTLLRTFSRDHQIIEATSYQLFILKKMLPMTSLSLDDVSII